MRVSTMRRGVRGRLAAVATTGALFAVLLSATPVAAFTTYTKCEPGSGVYASAALERLRSRSRPPLGRVRAARW